MHHSHLDGPLTRTARWIAVCLLIVGAGSPSTAPAEEKNSDREALQGAWELIGSAFDDEESFRDDDSDTRWVFSGDVLTKSRGGKFWSRSKYRLDPAKEPRHIDVTVQEISNSLKNLRERLDEPPARPDARRASQWVYRLEGNLLTIAMVMGAMEAKKRPTKELNPGEFLVFQVFQRATEDDAGPVRPITKEQRLAAQRSIEKLRIAVVGPPPVLTEEQLRNLPPLVPPYTVDEKQRTLVIPPHNKNLQATLKMGPGSRYHFRTEGFAFTVRNVDGQPDIESTVEDENFVIKTVVNENGGPTVIAAKKGEEKPFYSGDHRGLEEANEDAAKLYRKYQRKFFVDRMKGYFKLGPPGD